MSQAQFHPLTLGMFASVAVASLLLSAIKTNAGTLGDSRKVPAQGRRPTKTARVARQKSRIEYSAFSHTTHVTQEKLTCDSCHKFPTANWKEVRKGDAAFPDVAEFPEHASCLNCHRTQFFARERPAPKICSNCHVNVTPRNTTRFLFPSLGDVSDAAKQQRDAISEFAINFPHEKHLDVVSRNAPVYDPPNRSGFATISWAQKPAPKEATAPKSCPVCHQTYQPQGSSDQEYVTKPPKDLGDNFWLKKGTFKTTPKSHAACFTCHNVDLGITPAPSDCHACHKLAGSKTALKTDFDPKLAETIGVTDRNILTAWRRRISSGTFRHEGGDHPNISCLNCHNVSTMITGDLKSLIVSVRSCGGAEGCHITATSDEGGILNYESDQKKAKPGFVCTKCHITIGTGTMPQTHAKAMEEVKHP